MIDGRTGHVTTRHSSLCKQTNGFVDQALIMPIDLLRRRSFYIRTRENRAVDSADFHESN